MTSPVPRLPDPPTAAISTIQEFAPWTSPAEQQMIADAIRLVTMPIGDPDRLDAARVAWQSAAAGAVATSTNGLRQAQVSVKPLWEGPAAGSFDDYATTVIAQSDTIQMALGTVGTALADAHQEIYNTITAVMSLITEAAATILEFAGDVTGAIIGNLIIPGVIQAILSALAKLVRAYGMALEQAMLIIAGYKLAAGQAMEAIDGLGRDRVPTLPPAAADPDLYEPAPAPDGIAPR
jgi:hypothetical protein